MSSLHPKFTVSVYSEDVKFSEQPYDQTDRFAVYTVDHESVAKTFSTKYGTGENFFKIKSANNSPSIKPNKTSRAAPKQVEQVEQVESPVVSNSSKLKSKLTQEVELANKIDDLRADEDDRLTINSKRSHTARSSTYDRFAHNPKKNYSGISSPDSKKFCSQTNGFAMAKTAGSTKMSGSFIQMRAKTSQLQKTLCYDPRISSVPKTITKNEVIEDLLKFEDTIMSNPALLESIVKLRDMQLLKKSRPDVKKLKGVGKIEHVYNDFHTRSTNPGFSRNSGGVPYFR